MNTADKMSATINEQCRCPLIARLDLKLERLLDELEQTELYQLVFSPNTSPAATVVAVRLALLQSFYWVPLAMQSAFTSIGRMPHSRPDLARAVLELVTDELTHPGIALKDFVALGGDERWARSRRMTPEAFNIAALCEMLAHHENAFAFLGHFCLSESLTPILTQRAQAVLTSKGIIATGRKFIDLHAVEDIRHAREVRELIETIVCDFPEAESAIEYGFDCFAAVYPVPLWGAVMREVQAEIGNESPPICRNQMLSHIPAHAATAKAT